MPVPPYNANFQIIHAVTSIAVAPSEPVEISLEAGKSYIHYRTEVAICQQFPDQPPFQSVISLHSDKPLTLS